MDANSLSDKLIQLLIHLDVDADTVALGRKIDILFFFGGGGGNEDFLLDEFDVGFSPVESSFGDLWKLDLGVMMKERFNRYK